MSDPTPSHERPATVLPVWAERLLARLVPLRNRDVVLGDFAELFHYIAETDGRGKALRWYGWQVLRSLPAFLSDGLYFGSMMIGNYLKVAFRNLTKRAFFSTLNVGGLAVGMAACLLIFQYVAFEHSFDDFHARKEQLYRVLPTMHQNGEERMPGVFSWYGLGPAVGDAVPEVAGYVRVHPSYGTATLAVTDAQGQRTAFREERLVYADSTFFTLFSFPLAQGNPEAVLAEPGSILLSRSMAEKYFGAEDPLGKTLDVRAWVRGTYTVTGVFEDVPANSHLQFDFVVSMADLLQGTQYRDTDGWSWTNFVTYLYLRPEASPGAVAPKVASVVNEHQREDNEESGTRITVGLQPLGAIHLHSDFDESFGEVSNAQTVYFFLLIAVFVLIIAWINFINLSTARALERAREVGVRKAAGARRGQVVMQFLFESGLTNVLALGCAVGLAALAMPWLNALAGVTVTASLWKSPWFWGSIAGVFGLGAVLASLYPAFVLSMFQPVDVLKGTLGAGGTRQTLRKALVVFQFAASLALLIGTYAVYSQVDYMRRQHLGLNVDQMLIVQGPSFLEEGVSSADARATFKDELLRYPAIRSVATSAGVPGGGYNLGSLFRKEGDAPSDTEPFFMVWVNDAFVDTYGMELIAGRNLSAEMAMDTASVLLNETAVRTLGYDAPEAIVNQRVVIGGGNSTFTVVGVLRDFHWSAVKQPVESFGFARTNGGRFYSIKVETAGLDETLATVRDVYDTVFPGNPFTYYFADRYFDEQYREDQRFGTLFGVFAAFALFVACLGLVGLAAYTTAQRTKEIGVRKVLGAGTWSIVRLLLVDFTVLIGVALLVTVPLMVFALNAWLDDFATRIPLRPGLFLVPGLVVLLVALLTVSYHTFRVARTNPVSSLRYD